MSELDQALGRLQAHEGVEHLLLLGRDGLLIRHLGARGGVEVETVSAMTPGVANACAQLGRAGALGDFATAVVEFGSGIAIIVGVSAELLLTITVRPGVGFAPLLAEVRRERSRLAALL